MNVGVANPGSISGVGVAQPGSISGVDVAHPGSITLPPGNNGAYWIGADGKVYVAGSQGTNAAGVADANTDQYWTNLGYNRIADPNAPQQPQSAPVAPTTATGLVAAAAPKPAFNQAGADNTQRTIDEIPGLLQAALAAEATSHNNATGGFDAAQAVQQKTYDNSTVTNQNNYDSNFMDSIRAGIHGLGGLLSLLRGSGAGGGTAENLARDAVGGVTANDIRGGADTQRDNQATLDSSLAGFLTDLKTKRTAADDTFTNNNRAINRDSNTQLQDLFGKMAGFYGDVGNTADSNSWMNKAGALTPDIAANSKTQVSPYDTTPVIVHAPNLTAFAGPSQPNVVTPPPDGQVGSGIFTMGDSRRKKDAAVSVGV